MRWTTKNSTSKEINKVLLVDDEADIVSLVRIRLESGNDGFEVDAFVDPILALQNFKSGLYDLLLLDIKMQNMNGFELYNNIKKIDNKVKVCFFSASEPSSERYKQLVSKSKQDNKRFFFIQKPISMHDMIEQIKSILNNWKTQ